MIAQGLTRGRSPPSATRPLPLAKATDLDQVAAFGGVTPSTRAAAALVVHDPAAVPVGTDLDAHLRNAGIRDLVLCGVATNFVIDGTARQAVDAGFRVSILTDGCASFDPAWHETALQVLAMLTSQATVDDFASAIG